MLRTDYAQLLRGMQLFLLLTLSCTAVCADSPEGAADDETTAVKDPFDSDVWSVSFCTVGTRWCLDGTAEFPDTDTAGFRFDPAQDGQATPEFSGDPANAGPSLGDDDFDLKDDSLKSRVESIDRLPFVTVWKSDKAHLFVGVDKSGTAGLHLAPKPK